MFSLDNAMNRDFVSPNYLRNDHSLGKINELGKFELVLCIIVLYFPFFIVAVYYQSYYVTYFHICIMFWRVFFWKTGLKTVVSLLSV